MNLHTRYLSAVRYLLLASMLSTAGIAARAQEIHLDAPGSAAAPIVNGSIPMPPLPSIAGNYGKVVLWDGETGRCWTLADGVDLRQRTLAIPVADLPQSTKLRVLIRQEDGTRLHSESFNMAGADIGGKASSVNTNGMASPKIDVRRRGYCIDYASVPELTVPLSEMTFDCQDLGGRTLKDVDYVVHDGIITVCGLPADTYVVIRIGTKDGHMLRSEVILQDERSLLQRSTLSSPRQ